jgi:hypothetical protein
MAKDGPDREQPLREMEDTTYHAYREWPVLLMIRAKDLAAHQVAPEDVKKTEENAPSSNGQKAK